MRTLPAVLLFLLSLRVSAAPVEIVKGPVITGVGRTDAWVAWETSVRTGNGAGCTEVAGTRMNVHPPVAGRATFGDEQCGQAHHVHLTGLRPGTPYQLKIREHDEHGNPVVGSFTTAPATAKGSFHFVVYGDTRESGDEAAPTRPAHEALMRALQTRESAAAFLIQTGDLALNTSKGAGPERGYAEFFDVERSVLSRKPLFAALGNHDKIDTEEFDSYVNPRAFAHEEHPYYWSFDWGRLHLTFADTFEGPPGKSGVGGPGLSPAQARWLEQDMEAASRRGQAILVVTHHSPYSHVLAGGIGHGGSEAIASVLVPLMRRYHALGVFAGHDHFYERGREGCIDYVVVGSGGAPMYDPDPAAPGVAVAKKETAYVSVSVTSDDVVATAKGVEGEVLDSFHLTPADASTCRTTEVQGQPK
jgi:hypothetical protein